MSSPSDVSPLWGLVEDFFCHEKLSAKKGAKLASRDREYWRFCLQASNVVMVSFFVRDHCFGALLEFISNNKGTVKWYFPFDGMVCCSEFTQSQDRLTR